MRYLSVSDTQSRENNLTLVRLVAALAVIHGHSFALVHISGQSDPIARLMSGYTYSGSIAVDIFFALSGFLVARSYYYSPSIINWIKQRVFRIYPGLYVCVCVMLGCGLN